MVMNAQVSTVHFFSLFSYTNYTKSRFYVISLTENRSPKRMIAENSVAKSFKHREFLRRRESLTTL